ncbi:unnamed protein product, partial [Ixodes hexagonus]
MEPLGSVPDVVDIAVLKRWHQIAPREMGLAGAEGSGDECPAGLHERTPFPVSEAVNRKVALWVGDLTSLNAHAIVNSTNENLTDKSPLSQRIVDRAGEQLRRDMLNEIRSKRTFVVGDGAYTPPSQRGGQHYYDSKTLTISIGSSHLLVQRLLYILCLPNVASVTVAAAPLSPAKSSYIGCVLTKRWRHWALRCFCCRHVLRCRGSLQDGGDQGVVGQFCPLHEMPVYRPKLLYLVGTLSLVAARNARVTGAKRLAGEAEEEEPGSHMEGSVVVGRTAFARMQGDVDREGARAPADPLTRELQRAHRYARLLRKARMEDLRIVREARFFYEGGRDRKGRPVFVLVGRRFRGLDPEQVLLQLLLALDSVAPVRAFSVVYLHTQAEEPPELGQVLREAFELLEPKHRQNLHTLYLVHPSFWTRVAAWWFTAFKVPEMRGKVNIVSRLDELFLEVAPEQLDLPRFVVEYDHLVS